MNLIKLMEENKTFIDSILEFYGKDGFIMEIIRE